jgi:hypothetical protein
MTPDDVTLDALRRAVADPGDHRLFRAGKFPGLFPARTGASADAAKQAVSSGLLEVVRTEAKGKLVAEWVRVTPAGRVWVHDRDSTAGVVAELREVVAATRAGVPGWLADAKRELAGLSERFERQADDILAKLESLSDRLDAALRRADLSGPALSGGVAAVVPWAGAALAYLDKRAAAGAGRCPLGELFRAAGDAHPGLTLADFHAGLGRLADARAVRLVAGDGGVDPEYAMFRGAEVIHFAER